jgi:hypothetical protein
LYLSNQNDIWPKKNENIWLSMLSVIFFLSIWSIIILYKLYFESGHYQTVDGNNYFLLAHKIRNGQQFIIDGITNGAGKPFSPYPPGFPLLLNIGISIENLTNTPAVFSLHLLLLAGLFLIWIQRKLPLFPIITVCFTDTFIELACNPWSEFSFIICLIVITLIVSDLEFKGQLMFPLVISILLFILFLLRYAGIFILSFILIKIWYNFKDKLVLNFWVRTGFWFCLMTASWFLVEVHFFGQATGGDRYPNHQSYQVLGFDLLQGLFNQVLIFKDWSGSSFLSFSIGFFSNIIFLIWFLFSKKNSNVDKKNFKVLVSKNLILIGACYFAFIVPLRWYFYFAEGFDLRLLGPGSILLFTGLMLTYFNRFQLKRSKLFIVLWILLTSFLSLPKKEMYFKFQEKVWGNTSTVFPQSSQ